MALPYLAALLIFHAGLGAFPLNRACYYWGPPGNVPGVNMHIKFSSCEQAQLPPKTRSVWEMCLLRSNEGRPLPVDSGFYKVAAQLWGSGQPNERQALWLEEGPVVDGRPLSVFVTLPLDLDYVRIALRYAKDGDHEHEYYRAYKCPSERPKRRGK